MPSPKIFISHSAKEERTARVLEALAEALKREGFEVLLDRLRLQPNDTWREEILRWPWQCHASVIFFSEAVFASRWVKTEAGLLVSRRNLSRQYGGPLFQVLPVFFDPVTPQRLADPDSGFEPLDIPEIQAVAADTDEALVEKIVARLRPLHEQFGDLAPFGKLSAALVAVFDRSVTERYREGMLTALAQKLGASLDDFAPGSDPWLWVTERMLRADFGGLRGAVEVLGPFLGQRNAVWLCNVVAPFCWVDEGAAGRLAEVLRRPEGGRAAGLNSEKMPTARQYVSRASTVYPLWAVAEVEGGSSAAQLEELILSLRANVKKFLGILQEEEVDDDELNEELAAEFEQGRPLFVLVPRPVPDRAVIEGALAAFPHVALLLLTGDMHSEEFKSLNLPQVEFLLPELDEEGERKAGSEYRRLVRLAEGIEIP
jgi:hypothetical protein